VRGFYGGGVSGGGLLFVRSLVICVCVCLCVYVGWILSLL